MTKRLFVFLFFIMYSSFAQQVITFEQSFGTKSWVENGLTFSFVGGIDEIRTWNPKNGMANGFTQTGSNSKLVFSQKLNLNSVWISFSTITPGGIATIFGYDSLSNVIYQNQINASYSYQNISLNWQNVKSISFNVPEGFMPMMGPIVQQLNFDDINYTLSIPVPPLLDTIAPISNCIRYSGPTSTTLDSSKFCDSFIIIDFSNSLFAYDNLPGTLTFTQNIPIGTVIEKDTIVTVSISDAAQNTKVCSYPLIINKSSSSNQSISSPYIYQDFGGSFHYNNESFTLVLENSNLCDSTVSINYTKTELPNVLNFEVDLGSTTWIEDNKVWTFEGGTDHVEVGNFAANTGKGYGMTITGSNSKLRFPKALNLNSISVTYHKLSNQNDATIFGFDSLGNILYQKNILASLYGKQDISLNWTNVFSIGFSVPTSIDSHNFGDLQHLYFDDLTYQVFSIIPDTIAPIISCSEIPALKSCTSYLVTELRNNLVLSDNVSQQGSILSYQSIPTGTIVNSDTVVYFTAIDESGNIGNCSVPITISKNSSSNLNISVNSGYQDIEGDFHFTSEVFQNTITNASGCDSVITTNLVVSQLLNILNFEAPQNSLNWIEDGKTWNIVGGSDVIMNGSQSKSGVGYGKASSNSISKLVFPVRLDIQAIWIKPSTNGSMFPFYATLYGYDSLGTVLYSKNIDQNLSYHELLLNWQNVKSIGFSIPMGSQSIPGAGGMPTTPTPVSMDVFYDDISYTFSSAPIVPMDTAPPTIMCFNYTPNGYCNSYSVPDLRSNLMVSDNISQWNAISITQSIAVGTMITKDSLVSFTATDAAGNSASCSYILKINKNTNSTQNISANTSYKDISNVYHYNSETFQNTIPNSKGCDSVITTNLTINQVPNILNFDVAPNLTSWNEDGKTWIWDGSTDKVSNISTKAGYGAGRASSNTTSKLVFPVNLNISRIWINGQANGSMMPLSGQMRGYDDNGNVLYTLAINQTSGFEEKTLNWENVKSIGFTVPMGEMMMPGGMPGFPGGNTPISMDVYYDEMEYNIYSPIPDTTPPSLVCAQSVISANTCDFFVLPNLTLGNTVSDNISSVSNIFISQSIPFGTVISSDTTVFLIATDEAGNSDTCSVQVKTKKSSTYIQNVNSITSFKDVLGQFHYLSGSFVVVIPNSAGCDSTITYNLSLSQTPNVLNFDVAPNLSSWNEDGKSWSWTSGTDKIGNGSNAKAGNGFGSSISGSNSKLLFAEKLNLTNIWVLYPIMGLMQPAAQLKGYDENQQEIYSQNITPNSSYQNLSLTWSNVASIAFSIPNVMVQSGGSPMPTSNPQTIYFDELGYTEYIPDITPPIIVFCPPNEFVCENTPLKDYTSSVIASDLNGIASITQSPLPGSTVYPGGQSVTITVMDNAGLTSNCQLVAYTNPSTSSTLNVDQYESFISPLGNVYSSSGTFNETLVNHYGCDSIVTINYTRLVLPPASLEPILNFDKDIYCIKYFPDSVAYDSVFISVSCPQDAIIQWFDSDTSYVDGSNTRILHSFNSDYLNYGYFPKYLLRCKSSTDSSAFIDVSNGVNIGSSFGFPELKLNDNIVQNNHVENWCSILPISLVPTCYGNSVVNWIGETPSENPFYLNTSKTYTFYCDYATGCDGLPFSIHFVLPSAETGIPNATVLTEEINNCTEYVSIGFSGCVSNKYFLYESELNPNVAMSYSGENVNLPFTGNKTYKVYCGTFCSKSLTYDSIVIEAGITNIVLNAPIVNNDSINFCEKNSFVNYLNSKSCSEGHLIWKRKNINGIDENWEINAFSDFSEGDTLRLVCKFGNCVSSETIYKVNYKTSYPKPIINSIETVFCEGKEIVLSSPSCSSPDFYPNWRVFNDIYNTSTYFNTSSISVYLEQGIKVSLACVKNNVSYYCGSDTTLFIPQFVDNTLITNIQSSKDTLCHGETFNVTYTLEDTFPIGNVFTIQLSNELGDFPNPVIIGSGTSANQTTITVTLPQEIVAGNQYKIRVVPSLTNLGPGEFLCYIKEYPITILGSGAARLYNNNPFNCQGSQINLSAFSPYFNTYINDRSIRFFKNNIDITDESKTEQKDKYLKTYAENTDAGEYHVEMQYNGCSLKSANLNISFSVENNAPSIPDTTISVQRGAALNLAGTCSSNLLISPSTYAFYAPNPRLVVNNFKNFEDTTFYVACATGGCISDYRKVEISVFDPVNAPNAPILTVNIDSVCLNNEYYNNPQIVSATGCNGSIEWHIGNILEYPFETDIQAPYQLIVPYGKKIYANCIENGIMSKGFGQIDLNQIQTLDGHIPVISPTVYVNSPEQFTLTAGQNAPVHLEVEEYIKDGNTGSRHKYCSDGIIKWFDSEFNLLKSGKTFDTISSVSDIILYQACERGGKCEDKKRLIKVTVVDSVFINPSKSEYYICGSGSAILKANSCVSSNIKWYSDAQGMNLLQTGNNYITQNYLNVGITNIIDTFYVACNSGSFQTALKPVKVINSPVPQIPTVQDTLVNCNTPVVKAPIVNSCLSIEEPQWYLGGSYNSIMKEELYTGSVFSYSLNYDFRNIPVTYNVSCKNKLTTCESGVKQYSIIFDCTPPMPPIIEIENQTSIIVADKGGVSLTGKETLGVNEFCVGELVSLTAQNCVSGTIFWSDGYVGSPRSYNVKNGYINLVAVCKTDNYLKSESSNGLEFQSKPTPSFTLVDTVYSTSLVNLTADSVLTNLVLPVGSTISYFSDAGFLSAVSNPSNIDVSGNYFIKATATNACSFSDNVVVIIDNCGKVIGYYSPTDDIFNGNVDAKTRKQITAENKISDTARASFKSESNILLRPGFEAKPNVGGIFKAEIGGCDN